MASSLRIAQARSELDAVTQSFEVSQDLMQLRGEWASAAQPVHDAEITRSTAVSADISTEAIQNSEVFRQAVRLYREQAALKAQVAAIRTLSEMQCRLIERLTNQSTQNSQEVRQAELMRSLLDRQIQHAGEQDKITQLTLQSLSDLAVSLRSHPIHLSRIDEATAEVLLSSEKQQLENSPTLQAEWIESKMRNRLTSINALHGQGYASRQEVLNAEQQLLDAEAATEEIRVRRRQRDLDFQLSLAIFRWVSQERSLANKRRHSTIGYETKSSNQP